MTVTGQLRWDEGPLSVENQNARTELRYVLSSDDPENEDRNEAYNWLVANAPSRLYGLTLNRLSVNEQVMETPTERKWDAVAAYVLPESKKPKPVEVDETADPTAPQKTRLSVRSSSGRTRRRLYSRLQVEQAYNDEKWIMFDDNGRLLNLKSNDSEDSTAHFTGQGIDVPVGTVEMVVETVRLNEDVQVNGYLVQVAQYAAQNVINLNEYKGFPAGTLKLVNFVAGQRGGDNGATSDNVEPWDVTYTFEYAAEVPVGEIDYPPGFGTTPENSFELGIQGGNLKGWQYLDVLYVNSTVDTINGLKLVQPKAVRAAIHDIYREIDFATKLKI